ncbi:MAG: hypothetical protein PF795_08765 [Kiritimatiellae bacterium]|jgi:hypothetical protein|nr:hypothetical protein [Kiritimatiellia bacterium]
MIKITTLILAGLFLSPVASISRGALAISAITTTPATSALTPSSTDVDLLSITTGEGTFSDLVGGIFDGDGGGYFYQDTNPGSMDAALTGLRISDGVANVTTGSLVRFGSQVNASSTFFLFEINRDDNVQLQMIDSGDNVIGTYSLNLSAGSYGSTVFTNQTPNNNTGGQASNDQTLGGATFTLADFSGSGDTSDFAGFRFSAGGQEDVAVVGAIIPEASSLALMSMALLLIGLLNKKTVAR